MPTPHDPPRLLHPEEVRNLLEPGTPEKRWGRGQESEREQESEQELELESLPDR
jgi:hypothetical protein